MINYIFEANRIFNRQCLTAVGTIFGDVDTITISCCKVNRTAVLNTLIDFCSNVCINSLNKITTLIFSRVSSFGMSIEISLQFSFVFDLETNLASVSYMHPKFRSFRFVGNQYVLRCHILRLCSPQNILITFN